MSLFRGLGADQALRPERIQRKFGLTGAKPLLCSTLSGPVLPSVEVCPQVVHYELLSSAGFSGMSGLWGIWYWEARMDQLWVSKGLANATCWTGLTHSHKVA